MEAISAEGTRKQGLESRCFHKEEIIQGRVCVCFGRAFWTGTKILMPNSGLQASLPCTLVSGCQGILWWKSINTWYNVAISKKKKRKSAIKRVFCTAFQSSKTMLVNGVQTKEGCCILIWHLTDAIFPGNLVPSRVQLKVHAQQQARPSGAGINLTSNLLSQKLFYWADLLFHTSNNASLINLILKICKNNRENVALMFTSSHQKCSHWCSVFRLLLLLLSSSLLLW